MSSLSGGVTTEAGIASCPGEACRVEDAEWIFVLELVTCNGIFFVTPGETSRIGVDELGCPLRGVASETVV